VTGAVGREAAPESSQHKGRDRVREVARYWVHATSSASLPLTFSNASVPLQSGGWPTREGGLIGRSARISFLNVQGQQLGGNYPTVAAAMLTAGAMNVCRAEDGASHLAGAGAGQDGSSEL
jgi:hypothetical protein